MKLLFCCSFCFLVLSGYGQAGPSDNGRVARDQLSAAQAAWPPFRQVRNYLPSEALPILAPDSSSQATLQIGPATITYLPQDSGQFRRICLIPVSMDSSLRDTLRYQDELSFRQMRQVIRQSPSGLKGEDPTFRGKWLYPFASILLGTGITITLFYLRSR